MNTYPTSQHPNETCERYSCIAGKLHYHMYNRTTKTDGGNHIATLRSSLSKIIEHWYSCRSMTPETHTLKRVLHSTFTDCTTGTAIQLGGNLSYWLDSLSTPEPSLPTHCQV
ncbi:hypothetical protein TNCV_3675161 [Trichonephila clavipes]|nr:hypothetical protein TNCV_3675161 [Trichonephila clavipes]